jgi:beta-glucanase (GH16 family)
MKSAAGLAARPRARVRLLGPAGFAALVLAPALLSVAASCKSPAALTTPVAPAPPGQLVWADEFNGPAASLPSASNWGFDVGTDWGNAQLEYDTGRPTNVSLDGQGHLAITARVENYQGSGYTSGRIKTAGKVSRTGGRFEARMKLPTGRGLWPAFWLLGADIATNPWPGCGEIDIMEYRGQEPSVVHGSLHGPGYSGGNARSRAYVLPNGGRFDTDFHVFAVEWKTNQITWSVDGKPYHVQTPATLPAGTSWVFDHPFFIVLNLAVGGNYVGSPDASTVFPQTLLVDYVRVYQVGS